MTEYLLRYWPANDEYNLNTESMIKYTCCTQCMAWLCRSRAIFQQHNHPGWPLNDHDCICVNFQSTVKIRPLLTVYKSRAIISSNNLSVRGSLNIVLICRWCSLQCRERSFLLCQQYDHSNPRMGHLGGHWTL